MIMLYALSCVQIFLDSNKLEPLFELLGMYLFCWNFFVFFKIRNKIEINNWLWKKQFCKTYSYLISIIILY